MYSKSLSSVGGVPEAELVERKNYSEGCYSPCSFSILSFEQARFFQKDVMWFAAWKLLCLGGKSIFPFAIKKIN